MADFYAAHFDDWVVIYDANGKEIYQHHHPDWQDAIEWCGKTLETLSWEESNNDWPGDFPHTLGEWREHKVKLDARDDSLLEKEEKIRLLQEELDKLRNS